MALVRLFAAVALLAALQPLGAAAQDSPFIIEVESGPAWQSRNDVEIPNDGTATRFSLQDVVGSGPWAAGRVYVTWNPWERHGFRFMWAPFSLTEMETLDREIRFADATFSPGQPVEATYTFHSYRASYRHLLVDRERARAWVGFTAKIRDAEVALAQAGTAADQDDVGFVPLLHTSADWRLAPDWRLNLDAEALAGGPGRAVDAALRVAYDVSDRWTLAAGYRAVEGGADVTEVYNFAWLHYAALSVAWHR